MQPSNVTEEKFDTAKEFLDVLRISNDRWASTQNKWESPWIFRGQADANWHLLPSAWRTNNLDHFKQKYKTKFEERILPRFAPGGYREQIEQGKIKDKELSSIANWTLELYLQYFVEMQAVKEFTEFADKIGHPVPGANEFIVHYEANYKNLSEEDYLISGFTLWTEYSDPFNVNCSAVALAQHHGISTRLLDWTESPLIAGFFAAEEFTSSYSNKAKRRRNKRIAVWAISKDVFSGDDPHSKSPSSLQLIVRPRHDIGYLLAQKGVFTHDKSANEIFLRTGKWQRIEEIAGITPEHLKKLTLPVSEVGELLRLLWLEGISRAHLMPTYDNVTRALQTKAWWENKSV